jgi:hypothetical protein
MNICIGTEPENRARFVFDLRVYVDSDGVRSGDGIWRNIKPATVPSVILRTLPVDKGYPWLVVTDASRIVGIESENN